MFIALVVYLGICLQAANLLNEQINVILEGIFSYSVLFSYANSQDGIILDQISQWNTWSFPLVTESSYNKTYIASTLGQFYPNPTMHHCILSLHWREKNKLRVCSNSSAILQTHSQGVYHTPINQKKFTFCPNQLKIGCRRRSKLLIFRSKRFCTHNPSWLWLFHPSVPMQFLI